VFDTIVANSARLSGTEAGAIYVLDERKKEFQLRATYGMSEELIAAIRDMHAEISEVVGLETETHQPRQVADLRGHCKNWPPWDFYHRGGSLTEARAYPGHGCNSQTTTFKAGELLLHTYSTTAPADDAIDVDPVVFALKHGLSRRTCCHRAT
jgi:hypothetical protein